MIRMFACRDLRAVTLAVAAACVACLPSASAGELVLGQFTTVFGAGTTFRGGLIGPDETVAVILGIDEPGGTLGDSDTSVLFDTNHWADGDAVAAVADQQSDLDFATVADRFTNGSDELVWIGVGWTTTDGRFTAGGLLESQIQFTDATGAPVVDLHGHVITRIGMSVHNFRIDVPGHDPNQDGNWADVSGLATFTFYGREVPEPSSALLALVSLAAVRVPGRRAPHHGKPHRPIRSPSAASALISNPPPPFS